MTKVYSEKNSLHEIRNILSIEKPNSILLIRGNDSYENSGAKSFIELQLDGYNFVNLSGFKKNSFSQDIERTIDVIKQENVDFILIAGDLFNTSLPRLDNLKAVVTIFKNLKTAEI